MTNEQRIKNLSVPKRTVDVVIDSDAYCEIDDQFAISYLLRLKDRLNTKAIYAVPFANDNISDVKVGMEKSYDEILNIVKLANEKKDVFKGATKYLDNETSPVVSPASLDLIERIKDYSPENPLYIVAIGTLTNIASAILMNKDVTENAVLIWLGGHALHFHDTKEFNMKQDVAAARVVMQSGIPMVLLPCEGVVSSFSVSGQELEYWFKGRNDLADYLAVNTINTAEKYASGKAWSRVIWDVTAVAWLVNDDDKFMLSRIISAPIPTYDNRYSINYDGYPIRYVYYINRDNLLNDLIEKIAYNEK